MTCDDCDLSNEIKDELVLDKNPCPGLQVFNCSDSLRYFSRESILEQKFGPNRIDSQDVFSASFYLARDPEMLFYMMSLCPDNEEADSCIAYWKQKTSFTVSVYNIIYVFLNWGASPTSLRIDDDQELSSCFFPTLPSTFLPKFPAPHNVKSVLDSISNHFSTEEGNNGDKERFSLIKVLVTASLDHQYQKYRFGFDNAIYKVLQTFSDWDCDKASSLVRHLNLPQLGLQNATYICCNFSHSTSLRVRDLKVAAISHLLDSRFGLVLPFEPFPSLFEQLPSAEIVVERFRILEIHVLTQLINSLLIICHNASPACSLESIEGLCNWAHGIHSELMTPQFLYTVEGGFVKEKCVRLQADCVELWKQMALKNQKPKEEGAIQ